MRSSRRLLPLVLALTFSIPGLAHAQDPSLETPASSAPSSRGDHGHANGHIGWAAFSDGATVQLGNASTLAGAATAGLLTPSTVTTPAIGARWWLMHHGGWDLGIDAGLGFIFGTSSASATVVNPANNTTTTTTTSTPTGSGIYLHVGVPIAMLPTEHTVLNIIPEIDIGGAWANPNGNTSQGGFLFNIGGRVGPEVHLGFFGVPQFSIQPTVSLFLNVTNYGASTVVAGNTAKTSGSNTAVSFFTAGMGLSFFYYPTLS